MVYGWVTYLDD